jgi:RNA polymerase sigma-70 factor (sigma-E family)
MTFEEFAESRLPALLAFATVLSGQRATAEDIAQEVLIRAHGKWDHIGGLDRPDLYVRKMIMNEFLSWRRRSWRLVPSGDTAEDRPDPADYATGYAEHQAMLAQIITLPKRQRAVLVLRYYEDRGDAEIAELLGCTTGSVRAYAARALAKLRVEMRPGQPELSAGATQPKGEN